ncbi:helix-turn-helix transcriptional regulator [Selenihalanaerobacter shriftii]|uniref:Helix-turn-helix n=1 Tax=Selenihalanaerobacter shriftii TaxID=142842 RepID=A0A1T4JK64_9FIRM|nr:helix-turn-helix domain-containing protein [Selenihalanaerobacter shriftii]SJZ30544.1 Helix-turn-helix [Selenihalanaerobacter shriftii]
MRPLRELQKLIIKTRVRAGLSQTKLAEKLDTTQSAISKLESSDNFNPELKTFIRILHVLTENIEEDSSNELYEAFKEAIKSPLQEAAATLNEER